MRLKHGMAATRDAIGNGEFPPAIAVRGSIGKSTGLGNLALGVSGYGDQRGAGGVYQRRVTGYNNKGRIAGRERRTYYVRMRSYSSPNPNTPKQQKARNGMRAAVQAWRALTNEQQNAYNKRGTKMGRQGRFLFYGEFLKKAYRE